MANFGKKAKLECQKSTVKVECIVSVYDTYYDDEGNVTRYKIVVQRLQDQLTEEQAKQGLADALPYIVNKKHLESDIDGVNKMIYSHYDLILPEAMDAIVNAAKNCYETTIVIDDGFGNKEEKTIKNYCVKLDIGFNLAKGEAFFYRIKSGVNKQSLEKDIKYNLRHMPQAGRELTAKIIKDHENITNIAFQVYQDALALGKDKTDVKE